MVTVKWASEGSALAIRVRLCRPSSKYCATPRLSSGRTVMLKPVTLVSRVSSCTGMVQAIVRSAHGNKATPAVCQ